MKEVWNERARGGNRRERNRRIPRTNSKKLVLEAEKSKF